eukprot:5852533-Prymnesium_polylepis.1
MLGHQALHRPPGGRPRRRCTPHGHGGPPPRVSSSSAALAYDRSTASEFSTQAAQGRETVTWSYARPPAPPRRRAADASPPPRHPGAPRPRPTAAASCAALPL